MSRLNSILVLAAMALPAVASAQTVMVCSAVEAPSFTETLTISGSGLDAIIHLDDITQSGDIHFDENASEIVSQMPMLPANTVAFSGKITLKETPPVQGAATFFVQTSVLDGNNGQFFRFGGDGVVAFNCKKQ